MSKYDVSDFWKKREEEKKKKEQEEKNKAASSESKSTKDAVSDFWNRREAEKTINFSSFGDDINTTNEKLNSIIGGWQDADTMASSRDEISKMYDRLEIYNSNRNSFGDDMPDLTELSGYYKGVLDEWDSIAEKYGGFKNADEYNTAVKAWEKSEADRKKQEEEWKSADLDVRNAQVYALEYHLEEAKKLDKEAYSQRVQKNSDGYKEAIKKRDDYLAKLGYSSINELQNDMSSAQEDISELQTSQALMWQASSFATSTMLSTLSVRWTSAPTWFSRPSSLPGSV